MGPAIYVMAILGCGEADATCQQVSLADSRYESVEACNAATADAVARNVDLAFPVVVAQCRRADSPMPNQISGADVDLPEPGRKPVRRAEIKSPRKTGL